MSSNLKIAIKAWTVVDYRAFKQALADNQTLRAANLASLVVKEWPYEGDPSDPESYSNKEIITFPQVMRLLKEVSEKADSVFLKVSSPKALQEAETEELDVLVNLDNWGMPDYNEYLRSVDSGDFDAVYSLLSMIITSMPDEWGDSTDPDTYATLDLEQFVDVMFAVNVEIRKIFRTGSES